MDSKKKEKITPSSLHRKKILILGLILLACFFVFTLIVKSDRLTQFDFNTTVRLQDHIPQKYDIYFSVFSLIGSFEVMAVILAIVIFLKRKLSGFYIFIIFCGIHLVEFIGKAFLHQPGTPFRFHRYNIDFVFPTSYVQPGSSYPSGHTMRAFFLVTLIFSFVLVSKSLKPNTKIVAGIILFSFAVIMAISRISLGEHWATDVIGGIFLGSGSSLLSLLLL